MKIGLQNSAFLTLGERVEISFAQNRKKSQIKDEGDFSKTTCTKVRFLTLGEGVREKENKKFLKNGCKKRIFLLYPMGDYFCKMVYKIVFPCSTH